MYVEHQRSSLVLGISFQTTKLEIALQGVLSAVKNLPPGVGPDSRFGLFLTGFTAVVQRVQQGTVWNARHCVVVQPTNHTEIASPPPRHGRNASHLVDQSVIDSTFLGQSLRVDQHRLGQVRVAHVQSEVRQVLHDD